MPAGRDYANRLLEEANRALAPHLSGLQEALQSLRSHLTTSLEHLAPKLDALKSVDMIATGNILCEAIDEVRRQRQQDIAFIADFGRLLRTKETQEEILTHLLDAAHRYAPRVALLAVRNNHFNGWSSRGFSDDEAETIRNCSTNGSESPALARAVYAEAAVKISDTTGETALLQHLTADASNSWNLLPMKAMSRTIAILLATDAANQPCDTNALQILVDLTGSYLENLALRVLCEMKPAEAREEPVSAAGQAEAAPRPIPPVEPEPPSVAGQVETEPQPVLVQPEPALDATIRQVQPVETALPVPEIAPEPAPSTPEVAAPPIREEEAAPEPEVEPVQEPVPPVAAALEPVSVTPAGVEHTASTADVDRELDALVEAIGKPAPSAEPLVIDLSKQPAAPVVSQPAPHFPRPISEAKGVTEEEKLHADARRFARLLVSEIKLYNEQRLIEGREHRDIYVRLKRDIDKSREMYEKRVPRNVSSKFDYFNDEVVRILAENDPAKLGSDYPGPRVES